MGVVVEAPIPKHITGIYVFAVVNLLLMLCISTVDAEIIVRDTLSNETAAQYSDTPAKFGPDFPTEGLEGRLVYAEPDPEACGTLNPPPSDDNTYPWILLIARGGYCQFSDKVLNAQLHNYSAVIVHNYEHKEGRIPMGGDGSRVRIPSTFIGWRNGMDLRKLYDYKHKEYIVRIWEDDSVDYSSYFWPFLLVMAICILMVMIFLLLKFLRDHATRRLSRLSNKHLKKIPVRKFKKGDYYDTCAICLEEYEEGEKIRVLPCDHVYHRKCIDPWLTKNKKTCPVCKRRVIPGRDADSESGSEVEDAGATTRGSENTPLLGGRGANPLRPQYGGSVSGSTANPPLQDNRTGAPAESVSENGAVGGVGSSHSRSLQRMTPVSRAPSTRGNIQDCDERAEVSSERKRKRRARDWRRKREDEEENAEHRQEGAAGTSQPANAPVHRERIKKKKDKRRAGNDRLLNPGGDDRETTEGRTERDGTQRDVQDNTVSGVREATPLLVRIDEEKDEESYGNPGFSGNHTVVNPAVARRREMNEVV